MTIILIIFMFHICTQSAMAPLSTCFYNRKIPLNIEKFSLSNSTPLAVQVGGYSYDVVWEEAQTGVTSSSFAYMGYRMQYANSYMSFSASLSNINSANATFIFNPLAGSTFLKVQFSIILLKTCSGYVELILYSQQTLHPFTEFITTEFILLSEKYTEQLG